MAENDTEFAKWLNENLETIVQDARNCFECQTVQVTNPEKTSLFFNVFLGGFFLGLAGAFLIALLLINNFNAGVV